MFTQDDFKLFFYHLLLLKLSFLYNYLLLVINYVVISLENHDNFRLSWRCMPSLKTKFP